MIIIVVGIAGYFCSEEKLFLITDGFLCSCVTKTATTSSGHGVANGRKENELEEWSHHDSFDGFGHNSTLNGKFRFM